ncbi:281_t:CDS:2, partial [Acaulospora morrowiae]
YVENEILPATYLCPPSIPNLPTKPYLQNSLYVENEIIPATYLCPPSIPNLPTRLYLQNSLVYRKWNSTCGLPLPFFHP